MTEPLARWELAGMVERVDPILEPGPTAMRGWQNAAARNGPMYTRRRWALWPREIRAFRRALAEGVSG